MVKTVLIGLFLGITIGVSLAAEIFSHLGMPAEAYKILIAGLLMAILIINRGTAVIATFVALGVAALQPENVLLENGFDKDLLLATLSVIVLYPLVYRVMHS